MPNLKKTLLFLSLIFLLTTVSALDSKYFSTNFESINGFDLNKALQKADAASYEVATVLGVDPIKFSLVQPEDGEDYTFGSKRISLNYLEIKDQKTFLEYIFATVVPEYLYSLSSKHGSFYNGWFGEGLGVVLTDLVLKKQGISTSDSILNLNTTIMQDCKEKIAEDLSKYSTGYSCFTNSDGKETCTNILKLPIACYTDEYGYQHCSDTYCEDYPRADKDSILGYASAVIVNKIFDSNLTKISLFFKSAGACNAELDWGWDDSTVLYDFPTRNIRYHSYNLNPKIDDVLLLGGLKYIKFEDYNKQISNFENYLLAKNIPNELFISEKDIYSLNQLLCKGEYADIPLEISKREETINQNLPIFLNAKNDINNYKTEIESLPESKCKNELQTKINSISLSSTTADALQSKLSTLKNDINQCRFMPKEIVTSANTQTEPNPQQSVEGNAGTSEGDNFLISLVIAIVLMAGVIYGTHKYNESFNAPVVHTSGHHLHRKHGVNSFNYNNWALVIGGVIVSFIPIIGLFGLVFNCFLLFHLGKMDAHNKGVIWKAIVLIFFTGIILGLIVFFGSKYLENQRPKRY